MQAGSCTLCIPASYVFDFAAAFRCARLIQSAVRIRAYGRSSDTPEDITPSSGQRKWNVIIYQSQQKIWETEARRQDNVPWPNFQERHEQPLTCDFGKGGCSSISAGPPALNRVAIGTFYLYAVAYHVVPAQYAGFPSE